MKSHIAALLAFALAFAAAPTSSKRIRSAAAKHAFQREQPCPATGQQRGKCPGYTIDHVIPLACGGADAPANMQWQTDADALAKDKWERKQCGK